MLLAVAVALVAVLSPVRFAEAQTPPSIQGVAVTSATGGDGGYGLNSEIEITLTFSEAVSVTATPQLTLNVGGQQRTAGYSGAGTSTGELLFTYTVAVGDEDTDGIAVVANSLALSGGSIQSTVGSVAASLTHAALQADAHLVDGIAPTVRLDGVDTPRVSHERPFNVFFKFSEPVSGVTSDDVVVTNGSVTSMTRTAATIEHPENTRWVAVIEPAAEGPLSVGLMADAVTDAFGNGNAASIGALNVIAADPVTVEVLQGASGFAEGGDAEFVLTRSRDNGATTVSLSVEKAGEFMSGTAEVSQSSGTATTLMLTFIGATATLEVTFAAGETRKTISFPTEDDALDEPDGTITLSVPANPAQYRYIPGFTSSAVSQVRDNDEPFEVFLARDHTSGDSLVEGEIAVFRLSHVGRGDSPVSVVHLEFTEGLDLLDLGGAGARGYTHLGSGRISVDLSPRYVTRFYVPTVANDTIAPTGRITLVGSVGDGYVFSTRWREWTYLLLDNDTPSDVTVVAPPLVTEGDDVQYTLIRSRGEGVSRAALTVNLQLEQTGDYVSWPAGRLPDGEGRYTIPVTFAPSSTEASLTLTTSDDSAVEANGALSAVLLPSADPNNKYAVVTTTALNTVIRDNEKPQVSVAAVADRVTEGADAQFRFTRFGDDSSAVRVGLWVGGLAKIMTNATKAIVLTSEQDDLSQRLTIHGAAVDYILEFAAGESEKTLTFTTAADEVNEGDGWLGVTIVQRAGNTFSVGTGYAQVHVHDDDIPTVSISQVTLPTGAATLEGDTWVGDMPEAQEFSWVLSCTGNYEYAPHPANPSVNRLVVQMEHLQLANHPAHYKASRQAFLGLNYLNYPQAGRCTGATRNSPRGSRFVGPDGGTETYKLVPKNPAPPLVAEYREAYRLAKEAADAAGTLVTQRDIIHPSQISGSGSDLLIARPCDGELRYCPQYRIGTPHKISLNLINRDPTILIKAESTTVEEGQPARFIVERLWAQRLIDGFGSIFETVVALRASQNGQYITGALPAEITFVQTETSKIIELTTVDDSAFGADGSVTIELLPDTTGADLNVQGKYTTSENWLGHTPEGARSDRATIVITNNDTKQAISIAPASAPEGDSGSTNMTFTVTLANPVSGAVTVNYATADGTAIAGQDYVAASNGSATIAVGDTTAEFTVSVTGDETDEFNETFDVTISLPSGTNAAAILGGDTATVTGTIIDDDPVEVTITANSPTVEEGDDAVFTLTRSTDASEELEITFVFRSTSSEERLTATFEAGSSTTEVSRTIVDDAFVNYPRERRYEAVLLGDSLGMAGVEDLVWSPGTPASATVTVTDNDQLATVTVHAQQAFATETGPIRAIFRRTGGDISSTLDIEYVQFFLKNDPETDFGQFASITFPAGRAEVTSDDFTGGTLLGDLIANPAPASGALYVPWTLTTQIYGDGRLSGVHQRWEAGIPDTASTVLYDNDVTRGLELHAQYAHEAAIGDAVSITFTVLNNGTVASSSSTTITSVARDDADTSRDGQADARVGCTIAAAISVGASESCTATFNIAQADFDTTPLELDATASDGTSTSKPFRIYIRISEGVLVGFKETDTLRVTEGASATADLVVTREGSLDEEVEVAYITRPFQRFGLGSASAGEDYTDRSATPGIITFAVSQTEATISFNILQDSLYEDRERFEVVLQSAQGVRIGIGKDLRRVVIVDYRVTDYRPVATLHLDGTGTVTEDSGSVEFAVRLTNAAAQLLRYDISLRPRVSDASAGADFVDPTPLTVSVNPGDTEQTFTVELIDDDEVEDNENLSFGMTGHIRNPNPSWATLGTTTTATATIEDDDEVEPIEVRLAVTWGTGDFRNAITETTSLQNITVSAHFHTEPPVGTSRTFVPLAEDTTVNVQFDPVASSASPTDFQDFGVLAVVIPAGQNSGSSMFSFRPVDDDIDEDNERVFLAGSVVGNMFLDSSLPVVPASFVFTDDDTRGITVAPGFTMNLTEDGDPGTYTVVLDSQPTETVTIELQLDDTGHLNATPPTLTFDSTNWDMPQTVTVWAVDDGIIEVNQSESIGHEVSGGDYDEADLDSVVVSIADTTVAYIYLDDARALESGGHVEFAIRISPPQPGSPVSVRFSTDDGTATGGSDYTSFTGWTRSIPAGQSSDTIRIPITDDTLDEADVETFTLELTSPTNAKLAGDADALTATGSIEDDDDTPVLTLSGPDGDLSYVPEEASESVTFTLELSGISSEDVMVDYATGPVEGDVGVGSGTATAGADYIAASGTVTLLSGDLRTTITVQVRDDDISEGTEFFGVHLTNLRAAEFTNQQTTESANLGILDNDTLGVMISPAHIDLDEPGPGETAVPDSYSVALTSQPTATATVAVGGAIDSVVSLDNDTLTFTTMNWNTLQTVTVTPLRDADAIDEFVAITHTVTGGDYEGRRADDVGVRVDDSDDRDVIVSQPMPALREGSDSTYTVALASQPTATTTVSITVAGDVDVTINLTELTFTTARWDTPQTITVTAAEDNDTTDDTAELTHVARGSDYVSVTKRVSVTATDDDPDVEVTYGAANYTVAEGDTVMVTVTLSAAPQRPLVIPLTASNQGTASLADYTVPTSVTFGSTDTSVSFTFTATQDSDNDDGESVLLGFGTALPAGVTAGSTDRTVVTIDDDDDPAVSVSFASASYTVTEGDSVVVAVSLSAIPEREVVIPLSLSGTATAVDDYLGVPGSVTFGVSDTSVSFTVTAVDDNDDDDNEWFWISFGTLPSRVTPAMMRIATNVLIVDNDVSVSFGSGTYSVAEGSSVVVAVGLSAAPERPLVIPLSVSGTATVTADFSGVPGSVRFGVSDTSVSFTVTTVDDVVDDDAETVVVALGALPAGVTAAAPAETVVTIVDDDDPMVSVSFGSGTYSVAEGSSVVVAVSLSEAPKREVVVPLAVSGTATAVTDFSGVPGSVTFGVSDTSVSFTVTTVGDTLDDDAETVVVALGALPAGVTATAPAETVVTIVDDDDPMVSVSFGSGTYSVAEGSSVVVAVALSEAPKREVVVPLAVSGTATAVTDFSGVPGSVTFGVSDTSVSFTVTTVGDTLDDDAETVVVALGALPAGVTATAPAETVVTIVDDDDPMVSVSFGSGTYSVAEGSSVVVAVALSEAPKRQVVVPLAVSGTATAVTDFSGVPGSVTFGVSDTSVSFTVTTVGDTLDDDAETVVVALGALPAGVTATAPAETVVTIVDDDDPMVSVSFGSGTYSVAEGSSVVVGLALSEAPERQVVVPLAVSGTATAVTDFDGVPGSVTFGVSDTSVSFTVTTVGDTLDDDAETVVVALGALPAGVTATAPAETVVTIVDDDDPMVSVSFASATYSVAEGSSVVVAVALSEAPERQVVVPLAVSGTATAVTDFSGVPGSVTFGVSDTSVSFTVTTVDDMVDDDAETVVVALGALPAGVTATAPAETVVTIVDPRPPREQVDVADGTVVTITRVPDGTVIADRSSLWVGATVEDGSTFVEGTRALFRLLFAAVGGGPATGDGVDVEVSYFWHNDSPIVPTDGQPTRGLYSLHRVDVWDTAVHILDNDVGNPDGTVTIRITGCERSGCVIGTPSEVTLAIADDDGGAAAAPPGPPHRPRLVCASSGDGYDRTGIAVSWVAPEFVGGAGVDSYELRYRRTAGVVQGVMVLPQWEYWPGSLAGTSATLAGLTAGEDYTVEVRAANSNGPGPWSEPNYFRVGYSDEICEIIGQPPQ